MTASPPTEPPPAEPDSYGADEVPPGMMETPAGLDGISLDRAVLEGTAPPERPVFSQFSGGPDIGTIRRAVITRRYKYVYDPDDAPELFDLEEDPLEMRNRAEDSTCAEVRERLHEQCAAWGQAHGDWVKF